MQGFPDIGISLTFYDMSADEGKRLLYHRPSQISRTTDQPIPPEGIQTGLFSSRTFDFAERQWKIVFTPSDFYYQSEKMWESWAVSLGWFLLTTLLGTLHV